RQRDAGRRSRQPRRAHESHRLIEAMSKPLASISLDVDNLWSYLKIHGDERWSSRPSYLDSFIPYMLDVLERLRLKITFFVVGVDAAQPGNGSALKSLVEAGHEI